MESLRRKDFCFWVVPAHDGRVRKVRLSNLALALIGLCLLGLVGVFVFIASDYSRLQILRVRNYLHLKLVAAERDRLLSNKQDLESEVEGLKAANEKVVSYEKQVRERVNELAAVIRATGALSPYKSKKLNDPGKGTENMGGGEVPCGPSGCSKETDYSSLFRPSAFDPGGIRASISPTVLAMASLNPRYEFDSRQVDMVEVLDQVIVFMKTAPIGTPVNADLHSGFGLRHSPFGEGWALHEGIDFALPRGSPIVVTADGIVRQVKYLSTYGLMVDVEHGERMLTRYAHLSRALVRAGQKVSRGDSIALVGSTGRSTGPHLHYEVHLDGRARDPLPYVQLAARLGQIFG